MRTSRFAPCLAAFVLSRVGAGAQTTSQASTIRNGVTDTIQLPQDAPPTGMQRPVPPAMLPAQNPEHPLTVSPQLKAINARLATRTLTIDDAISIALSTNRDLALAGEALDRAEGRTSEAKSALNPTLGVSGGDVYLDSSLQPDAIAGATLPLDVSGLLHAATSQAQFDEVIVRLDVNRIRNQIIYQVEHAFYDVLRAEALAAVATENLQNSLFSQKDAELKYREQAVAYYDVVRARTEVANSRKQVIQARNGVSLSIADLNNAMGTDITTPLRVSDHNAVQEPPGVPPPDVPPLTPESGVLPSGSGEGPLPAAPSPSGINPQGENLTGPQPQEVIDQALRLAPESRPVLQEALVTRPEVLEGDAGIAAARKGILIARRSQLPRMAFTTGYVYERNSTGTTRINEPQFELGFTLPIFDGGLARAREKEARADVASAITFKRQAIDHVTLDVQQAYLNLTQARDQVAVANQALSQARAAFQLARTRYNAGVATKAGISPLLEFSDAQAALTLAESNQVNALYDYNDARAQLDRAVGRFAYIGTGPGYAKTPSPQTVGRSLK